MLDLFAVGIVQTRAIECGSHVLILRRYGAMLKFCCWYSAGAARFSAKLTF